MTDASSPDWLYRRIVEQMPEAIVVAAAIIRDVTTRWHAERELRAHRSALEGRPRT